MFQKFIDGQYRRPRGLVGRWIGGRMAQQHQSENLWTVTQLNPQPTDHILEIGFGPGLAVELLAQIVTHGGITGIDFSPTMVDAARKRNRASVRAGRIDLRLGEATNLPFEAGTFDKAFSIHSIYFWPEPLSVLQAICRVLKPAGMLVITILPKEKWNADNPNAVVGTPECTPYSGSEVAQMMSTAGFSETRISTDSDPQKPSNFSVTGVK